MTDFRYITDKILEEDGVEGLDAFLAESKLDDLSQVFTGDETLMNYTLLMAQYLEDRDITMFPGWEKAILYKKPEIRKFHCTFWFLIDKDTDPKGALRVVNTHETQNEVKQKKFDDGRRLIRFTILKQYLDDLEEINRDTLEQKTAADDMEDID